MTLPMVARLEIWLEIGSERDLSGLESQDIAGWIAPPDLIAATSRKSIAPPSRRFVWLDGLLKTGVIDAPLSAAIKNAGVAIHAPNGFADLDHASAMLRLYEAQNALADGATPLLAFMFPTLPSLAIDVHAPSKPERLAGLVLDEHALAACLPDQSDAKDEAAPLTFARAKLVAHARHLGVPAYLRPRAAQGSASETIRAQAYRDGFDGIIVPPHA